MGHTFTQVCGGPNIVSVVHKIKSTFDFTSVPNEVACAHKYINGQTESKHCGLSFSDPSFIKAVQYISSI